MKLGGWWILLFVLFNCAVVQGQRLPIEISKTVVPILSANGTAIGTGFLMTRQSLEDTVLVTAKHVLRDSCHHPRHSILVRFNKKTGGTDRIEIKLAENALYHPDSTVDLALVKLPSSLSTYELLVLPESLLATREKFAEHQIREGDEVFFTGVFDGHVGRTQFQPLARFGRVALIPKELVTTKDRFCGNQYQAELLLIETLSLGGMSGSPVFYYFSPFRPDTVYFWGLGELARRFVIAGVIHGHYTHKSDSANYGIALVTPAHLLSELLMVNYPTEKLKH